MPLINCTIALHLTGKRYITLVRFHIHGIKFCPLRKFCSKHVHAKCHLDPLIQTPIKVIFSSGLGKICPHENKYPQGTTYDPWKTGRALVASILSFTSNRKATTDFTLSGVSRVSRVGHDM